MQLAVTSRPQYYKTLKDSCVLSERIVEDFESSESFLASVSGGRYFLKLEENAAKFEFLRRPQIIFKKELVDLPKRFVANRRFEEAVEVNTAVFFWGGGGLRGTVVAFLLLTQQPLV